MIGSMVHRIRNVCGRTWRKDHKGASENPYQIEGDRKYGLHIPKSSRLLMESEDRSLVFLL